MKKIYSIRAGALLAGGASIGVMAMPDDAEVVLQPTAGNVESWTRTIGPGNSGQGFIYTGSPSGGHDYWLTMWNSSEAEKDLWLTTPAVQLEKDKAYTLEYDYQTWDPFKLSNLAIYVVDAPVVSANISDVDALTPIYTVEDLEGGGNNWFPQVLENVIEGEGTKYIAFHVWGACVGRFSISALKVYSTSPALPKAVAPTGLSAVAGKDGAISVELSWTLPTLDNEGGALTGDNAITGVNIYRNDEMIMTLEGVDTHFTDTEVTGLSTGSFSYAVSALTANGEGEKSATVESGWVGPWTWTETELTVSSDNPAPETAWSYSRNNTGVTVRSNSANPGDGFTNSVQTWNNNSIDDVDVWISSPRLDMPVGRTYKVSFQYRFNPNTATEVGSLTAYMSNACASSSEEAASAAESGDKLLDVSAVAGEVNSSTPWETVIVKGIKPTETPQYLNFHLTGTVCKGIYISGLTVEEYTEHPFKPAAPENLTATAAGAQKLEVSLNWTNPAVDIDGLPFEDGRSVEQVYIYRDDFDTPIFTLEGDLSSFTDSAETGLEAGSHTYKVQAVVAGVPSDMSEEASVVHVGPPTPVSLPWVPTVTGMTDDDFSALWLSYCGGSNVTTWTNRPAGLYIMNSTYRSADSWLISAPIDFNTGKNLDVTYQISTSASGFVPNVQIGLVDSTEPTGFVAAETVTKFGSEVTVTLTPVSSVRLESAVNQKDAAAPSYRLAIHDGTQDPDGSYNLALSKIEIKESLPTGVETIGVDVDENEEVYDLTGKRIHDTSNLSKGIYIIRKSNGETSKIIR